MNITPLRKQLRALANLEKAEILKKFFKSGPGDYGEGDIFLGIPVPILRKLAKQYPNLAFGVQPFLDSKIHEERMLAVIMLVNHFQSCPADETRIYRFFMRNLNRINNWDLVDLGAPRILGAYLLKRPRLPLYRLVQSSNFWYRRCAIVATHFFIRRDDFKDTLEISRRLMQDPEDLIHKAIGWMLREVGKRHLPTELAFLDQHAAQMPRTSLRYALERLPAARRRHYLSLT